MDFRVTGKVYQNAMLEFSERQSERQSENEKKKVLDGTHPF